MQEEQLTMTDKIQVFKLMRVLVFPKLEEKEE